MLFFILLDFCLYCCCYYYYFLNLSVCLLRKFWKRKRAGNLKAVFWKTKAVIISLSTLSLIATLFLSLVNSQYFSMKKSPAQNSLSTFRVKANWEMHDCLSYFVVDMPFCVSLVESKIQISIVWCFRNRCDVDGNRFAF